MRKITIINACTDLGVNVNGASLGAEALTKNLNEENVSHCYTIRDNNIKKKLISKIVIPTAKILTILFKNLTDYYLTFMNYILKKPCLKKTKMLTIKKCII